MGMVCRARTTEGICIFRAIIAPWAVQTANEMERRPLRKGPLIFILMLDYSRGKGGGGVWRGLYNRNSFWAVFVCFFFSSFHCFCFSHCINKSYRAGPIRMEDGPLVPMVDLRILVACAMNRQYLFMFGRKWRGDILSHLHKWYPNIIWTVISLPSFLAKMVEHIFGIFSIWNVIWI